LTSGVGLGAAAQTETLDRARLAELANLDGPGDFRFRRELLAVFETSSARQLEALRRASASSDLASAVAAAYSLKGSASNVGALLLAASAAELESRARQAERLPAESELAALAEERLRALATLRREWHPA